MSVLIRPFEPRDQQAARRLILHGLGEHFGFIDETRNPDLDDIQANYVAQGHVFVVAERDGELVGTGGLTIVDEHAGRIVRMSVDRAYRRRGIGRTLVMYLLDRARERGFARVFVSTEHGWEDAIGFYKHCGFIEYNRDEVNVYFERSLEDSMDIRKDHS
jgi:N-acetylglutamate synthase-like GNAT family acetyltransferase